MSCAMMTFNVVSRSMLIGDPQMAPTYPGAAPRFLITDQLEDGPWLSELLRVTHDALPAPKPKKKKSAKKKPAKKKTKT